MLVETYVLYFPDTESLGSFLIENDVGHVMVDTRALSLSGALTERLVKLACAKYKAYVETFFGVSD